MTRERLGPYRIVKPLGAGGMGEVIQTMGAAELARDVATGHALYGYARMRRSQMPRTPAGDTFWVSVESSHQTLMAARR